MHLQDDHGGDHGHEKDHHVNKVKNIQVVEFGRFEMDTWYYAPYPEPYSSQQKLYICEYTLKYFRKKKTLIRHLAKLDLRHPPGVWVTWVGWGAWGLGGRSCPVSGLSADVF